MRQVFTPVSDRIPIHRSGALRGVLRMVDEGEIVVGDQRWRNCLPTNPSREEVEAEIERLESEGK